MSKVKSQLSLIKKLIISLVLASVLLVSLVTPYAQAQVGTWYHPTFGEYATKVYDQTNPDEIFGERYTQAQVIWILHALKAAFMPPEILLCIGTNFASPTSISACLAGVISGIFQAFGIGYVGETNLAQVINNTVSNNPISGIGYIQNKLSQFHLIPQAEAQGFGFSTLSPIQEIWKAIRNIAYFLLVIAFVAISFMVMFRLKISPQTVITIQSAIPRMIFVLLLITFSYAIAGFVIDLSFVSVGLLAVAADSVSSLSAVELYTKLIGGHPMITMFLIVNTYITAYTIIPLTVGVLSVTMAVPALFIQGIIFLVIIAFFILIWLRILWTWIKTFINIVLLIVFGPIIILGGIFPNTGGFGSWLRDLVAQVAVFPGIIAMFFLAHFIFWSSFNATNPGIFETIFTGLNTVNLLNPYGIQSLGGSGTIHLPGFDLGTGINFGFIVAIGILALVPNIANIIQSLISKRPFGYGSAIGAAIMTGVGIGAQPITYPYGLIRGGYEKKIMGEIEARGWRGLFSAFGRKPCLSEDTLIDTPKGAIAVQHLKKGVKIWTLNKSGLRISVKILKAIITPVPKTHIITHLVIDDGRELFVSPGHPRSDGYTIADLKVADVYDGGHVTTADNIFYQKDFTYDILPAGETGLYWANGILVGSTLSSIRKTSIKQGLINSFQAFK
ncbi:hypothetical protein A2714_03045 [Candidatus Woesebacteria bacterium RIFCSPHIGHO2_01_FULL_38_9]|uniref:Hint domain-containing protein n=2 Tax=Candidatus Woeseibacteriota TaxID=1752722 RepID=A0A1F7Y1I0_9BACT|nr:MAG: hypothetical protein A2714_03045 [Candidatus Woesebacteria bacterium RIFCSPHIGHO2_01_FULL_38_9]OGM59160.1 MAG: hypothetical protein A3A75_02995 [Candidatus Woesebacteria bacterium RIFCSPLOWO2_01_FULL_39_10]